MIDIFQDTLTSEEINEILAQQRIADTIAVISKDGHGTSFVNETTYLRGRYPSGHEIVSTITGKVETEIERRYVKPVITIEVTAK